MPNIAIAAMAQSLSAPPPPPLLAAGVDTAGEGLAVLPDEEELELLELLLEELLLDELDELEELLELLLLDELEELEELDELAAASVTTALLLVTDPPGFETTTV